MLHAVLKSTSIDRFEAELLLAHVLGKNREFVVAHPETKIPIFKHWYFLYLIKQRKKNVPIAYLTGHKEFFGLDFFVNKHTLVPRPETEVLVEMAINELQEKTLLVDIGTGSGCIPISILHTTQTKPIQTIAVDISQKALRVAKKNAQKHQTKITFLQGSLLEPLLKQKKLHDHSHIVITANLPYLTEQEFIDEPSIQHEPKSALVADQAGLDLYYKLLEQVIKNIEEKQSLSLYMEINPEQVETLTKKVYTLVPNAKIEIKKDPAGRDRVMQVRWN